MTPAELMDNRQRAQSIAFLRTLRAGDEGQTIYQGVIDDVLAELDAARAEADDLRRGQVATLLRQVDELRADSARGESRALASQDEEISRLRHELRGARAVKDAKATPARLDPTGTAEPRTHLSAPGAVTHEAGPMRAALAKCRDALQTIASCHACKGGITLGFAVHCVDCSADCDAREAEVDLDVIVQDAWEAANAALATAGCPAAAALSLVPDDVLAAAREGT